MKRWQSLWKGPQIHDRREYTPDGGIAYSLTWTSTGLYALDMEDRAWTLAGHIGTGEMKWFLVDELLKVAE